MTMYRIVCIEPASGTCLHHEQNPEFEPLYTRFTQPLDDGYLYQVKKAYPEAAEVIMRVDLRTENTDWTEVCSRVIFLP